jgi:hypothetical protein
LYLTIQNKRNCELIRKDKQTLSLLVIYQITALRQLYQTNRVNII